MRFMELLSRRKAFTSFTLSHMLVLFVTLCASSLFYIKSVGIIDEGLDKQRLNSLLQFKSFIDMHLDNVKMLGSQIKFNDDVIMATRYHDRDISSKTWTNKRIADYMEQLTVANGFIKQVGVYLPQSEIVITNNGTFYPDIWYKAYFSDKKITYDDFKARLNKFSHAEFYVIGNPEKKGSKAVFYVDSLTPRAYDRNEGSVFILFDFEKLKLPDESLNSPNVFIMGNNRNTLFSSRNEVDINIAEKLDINGAATQNIKLSNSDKYVVSNMKSNVNSWLYISAIPLPEYEQRLFWIKGLAILCFVVSLAIGLAIAIIFSRNNYRKLLSITGLLGGGAVEPTGDEYNYIREHIREMMLEQTRMTEKVNRQDGILRNVFLNRLLTGKLQYDADTLKLFTNLELDPKNEFVVMLIDTEHFETNLIDAKLSGKDYGFVPGIISYIVQNAMECELQVSNQIKHDDQSINKYKVLVTEINGLTACLLLLPSSGTEGSQEMHQEVNNIAGRLRDRLQEELGDHMSISISQVHRGFSECSEAYNEASDVMEYIKLIGVSTILHSDDFKNKINNWDTYFDSSNELFKNCIKAEDFNKAKVLVDEIFTQYVNGGRFAPLQVLKSRMISFSNAFLGVISEISADIGKDIFEQLKPSNRLLSCRSILDMKNQLELLIDELAKYIDEYRSAGTVKQRREMLDFIENNLTDKDLSVTSIADHFGITQCQLSRYFKKEFDMGILEYIHSRRLNRVKILIGEGLSLNDAAEKTGFYNDAALIRVFKKYEKITPGKFRDKIISRKL